MGSLNPLLEAINALVETAVQLLKLKAVGPLERELTKELTSIFREQGRAFGARLRRRRKQFSEALQPKDWQGDWEIVALSSSARMRRALDRSWRKALRAGGLQAIGTVDTDIAFDLKNPRAVRFLRNRAARRVTRINAETRRQLKTILTRAGAGGWSYQRTAKAITDKFAQFAVGSPLQHIQSRAELVAVTEIGEAYEWGNRAVAEDVGRGGVKMEKGWLTVGDRRVDEAICGSNEAAGFIPMNDTFPSGHDMCPGHPGCRCTNLYQPAGG